MQQERPKYQGATFLNRACRFTQPLPHRQDIGGRKPTGFV